MNIYHGIRMLLYKITERCRGMRCIIHRVIGSAHPFGFCGTPNCRIVRQPVIIRDRYIRVPVMQLVIQQRERNLYLHSLSRVP